LRKLLLGPLLKEVENMSLRGNLIEEVVQGLHLVFHASAKENEKLEFLKK
jgi:hypothetical protein